jgi:phosphohistidine phosphatase SixA
MGILLVRHGDAVEASGDIDDASRWLSAYGRERARKVATLVAEKAVRFSRFVASPRVRAVQTAELFAAVIGFTGVIEILPSLSFTAPAKHARAELESYEGNVAAFGHMPTITELCGLLANGQAPSFAAAEAVYIDGGRLAFRVAP